jgi:hypothetical protein
LTTPLKWSQLQTPGSVVPTDCADAQLPDAAAARAGSGYADGVYHARCNCRMREFEHATFCVVCRQQILDKLATGGGFSPGPSTFRLILDSFRLKTLTDGEHVLDFSATEGTTTVTGRWPKSGTVIVMPGRTEEPGYGILEIPLPASAASSVQLTYSIFGRDNSGGLVPIEAQTISVSMPAVGRGSIQQFDQPSHRITFGVARK